MRLTVSSRSRLFSSSLVSSIASLALLVLSPGALAQPEPVGDESILFASTTLRPTVATLATETGYLLAAAEQGPGDPIAYEIHLYPVSPDLVRGPSLGSVPSIAPFDAYLVSDGAGGALLLWREFFLGSTYRMAVRHFPVDGEPGETFELTTEPWVAGLSAVTPLASGQFLAVWRTQVPDSEEEEATVLARRFGVDGPIGAPFQLAGVDSDLNGLQVIAANDGGFLAAWSVTTDQDRTLVKTRRWRNGVAGTIHQVDDIPFQVGSQPNGVARRNAGFQLVWRGVDDNRRQQLLSQRLDAGGRPLGTRIEIVPPGSVSNFGRSQVARDPIGRTWITWPEGVPGTGDLVAQILDGEGALRGDAFIVNGPTTGAASSPRIALGAEGRALVSWIHGGQQVVGQVLSEFPEGACQPSETTLCLGEGRFSVEVAWSAFDGTTGAARDTGFSTEESGLLWFFGPDNWELLVKVLDGCAFNGHFWVFAAASTDVGYELTITDTLTAESRLYTNSLGEASPAINDTTAFASCDKGPR